MFGVERKQRLGDLAALESQFEMKVQTYRGTLGAVAYNSALEIIKAAPTVEAVEVVRCKDCKWAEYGKDYEPYCNHWKSGLFADIKDDDFCSYGERRCDNG